MTANLLAKSLVIPEYQGLNNHNLSFLARSYSSQFTLLEKQSKIAVYRSVLKILIHIGQCVLTSGHPCSRSATIVLAPSEKMFENFKPFFKNGTFRVFLTLIFRFSSTFCPTGYRYLPDKIAICNFWGGKGGHPQTTPTDTSYSPDKKEQASENCKIGFCSFTISRTSLLCKYSGQLTMKTPE